MEYLIQTAEMAKIIELLHRVLKIRITFFDLQEEELLKLNLRERSSFCRKERRDPAFNARCIECDKKNLITAKMNRDVYIYHCHAGLLEGIVPLYNRSGVYLGAIVFGQVRDPAFPLAAGLSAAGIGTSTPEKMQNIGNLLKYLSEYICENELIKRCSKPWNLVMEEYVEKHLQEKITLKDLAVVTRKSVSFLSHNIPAFFGKPLKQYLRDLRMKKAVQILQSGMFVRECAFAIGYQDEFYFSRDFKKYYGFPPKSLRKQGEK